MNQRFSIERQIQPAAPVLEYCDEVFPEDLIGLIVFLPVPRLDFKLAPLVVGKCCVDKSRFDLRGPKVD